MKKCSRDILTTNTACANDIPIVITPTDGYNTNIQWTDSY